MTPRDILSGPEKWCQDVGAVDKDGRSVDACSPLACRWCMASACLKIADGNSALSSYLRRHIRLAIQKLFPAWETITGFNDSKTWSEVDAVLNEAFPKQ